MALPLPKVVADVEAGGPFVTAAKGVNALRKAQADAQWAPYTNYANALSKIAYAQYSPLDIQQKILNSPALLQAAKDDPQLLSALTSNTNMLMKRMQGDTGAQGNIGGFNLPQPGQMPGSGSVFGGILGMLGNMLSGKGGSQNSLNESPTMQGGTPSVGQSIQGTQGAQNNTGMFPSKGLGGYIDMRTAPMSEQLHKPGVSYVGPDGQIHSTPTEATVSGAQAAILASKRVAPQLQRLSKSAAPFMTLKGKGQVTFEKIKNFLTGGDSDLPSQYADFQAEIKAAPESLLKTYGLKPTNETIERMEKVIVPTFGESAKGYEKRILKTLEQIRNEQGGTSEKALSEGLNVSNKNKAPTSSQTPDNTSSNNKTWPAGKEAINESDVEGKVPPTGTKWMISPDGYKVPVHNSKINMAKTKLHFREV